MKRAQFEYIVSTVALADAEKVCNELGAASWLLASQSHPPVEAGGVVAITLTFLRAKACEDGARELE